MELCLLLATVLTSGPHRIAKKGPALDHSQDLHEGRCEIVESPAKCGCRVHRLSIGGVDGFELVGLITVTYTNGPRAAYAMTIGSQSAC